ncbi:MAG TPA: hypothetical protein VFZ73_01715, partial [Gemmatimonadaceae bacterium]
AAGDDIARAIAPRLLDVLAGDIPFGRNVLVTRFLFNDILGDDFGVWFSVRLRLAAEKASEGHGK